MTPKELEIAAYIIGALIAAIGSLATIILKAILDKQKQNADSLTQILLGQAKGEVRLNDHDRRLNAVEEIAIGACAKDDCPMRRRSQ
jgi:hypothetical protein